MYLTRVKLNTTKRVPYAFWDLSSLHMVLLKQSLETGP